MVAVVSRVGAVVALALAFVLAGLPGAANAQRSSEPGRHEAPETAGSLRPPPNLGPRPPPGPPGPRWGGPGYVPGYGPGPWPGVGWGGWTWGAVGAWPWWGMGVPDFPPNGSRRDAAANPAPTPAVGAGEVTLPLVAPSQWYCPASGRYYPQVNSCAQPWMDVTPVDATPPAAPPDARSRQVPAAP